MAELFADPSFWKNNGQQPAGNYTGVPEVDRELDQMPEEERQAAIAEITAPPTGEEIAGMIQAKQAVGEVANITREQYRLYKAYSKTKETDVIEAIGMGAEMVWNDLQKAAGSMYDKPIDSIAKLTPSFIEAFSQGTRSMYGMLAESQDPNSTLFRVKNAIFTGSDEDAEYEQFMQALDFNAKSTRLMQGKETMVMDKDLINPEVTQAMSYIADPSLFIPFEGVALKGAQLIGMAEGIAKASARATAIKQMVIGGTLKWGVGAPIEAIGGATRATIDAAVDRGSRAISAVTGMQTGEIASAARMTGLSTLTADAAGLASGVSQTYVGASAARGIGEAIGAVGEQIMRGERGVLSYAGQALRESVEGGAKLTPQAENLLKAIDFVDPMFSYTADVTKGMTQGAFIGGGLGYLSGGEEGMAQGIGAGAVLGGVGAGFGRIYADISGATKTDRMRITTDLGLNILAETNPTLAKDYATLRAVAQAKGINIDGYISGLLRITPDLNTYFKGGVDHSAEVVAYLRSIMSEGGGIKLDLSSSGVSEFLKLHSDPLPEGSRIDKNTLSLLDFGTYWVREKTRPNGEKIYEAYPKTVRDSADRGRPTLGKTIADIVKTIQEQRATEFSIGKTKEGKWQAENTKTQKYSRTFETKDEAVKFVKEFTEKYLPELKLDSSSIDPKTYDGSFVDQNGRRLLSVAEFERAEGFVIDKAKDGKVTLAINLDNLKKNTVPHEAFHTIFRSVVMEPEFQKRMTESVLGAFDKDGKQISAPKVSQTEAVAFFDRYLKALHKGDKLNEQRGLLKQALEEYYRDGQTKVMAEDGKTPFLANLSEEFGAYYFTQFIEGKPLDYLFLGGELGGVRGIMQSVQDGWLDYWEGRAKRVEPKFNMANPDGIDYAFKPKGGSRVRVGAIDYLMQDLVRAASQRRQDGSINLSRMSRDTRDQFLRSQGLDGVGETRAKPTRIKAAKGQNPVTIYNKTFGPEVHKALLGLPDNVRPAVDGNGDFTGPLSKEVLEKIVSTGHMSREMANKIQVLQDMASGKMQSNIAEMGYIGWTEQQGTGPNPPRLYGDDVSYKRRKVLVLGVDSKVGPKGMSFNARTLDWQVIETRANNLWSDSRVRNRWNDDRSVFVQDFFRYLSNASKTDAQGRVPSNKLWAQDGDVKRDVMQQMAGIPRNSGETYAHPVIAEIHEDILNSVMNLTVNRMSDLRVSGDNVFFNEDTAKPFIRVNMKVADMPYEETPNGKVFTDKQSGFRFTQTAKGVTAFDRHGEFIGSYANLEDAGKFAKRVYERQQAAMKQVAMQVTDEASRGITYKSKAQLIQDNVSMSVKSWLDSKISAESSNTNKDYIIASIERGIRHLIDEQGNPNKILVDAVNAGFSESQNALAQANILKKLKAGEAIDAKELAAAFHPKALDSNGKFTGKTAKLSSEGILFAVESPDGKTEIKLDRHIETLQIELNKAISSSSDAWEAMFPRTFRSRLLDKVQKLHEQNPKLTYEALASKLLRDSSGGYRFYAEAEAIGLLDFLRSKYRTRTEIQKQRDAQGNWTGGIKEKQTPFAIGAVPLDIEEVSNWIYNKELTLQVDDGARADLGRTSHIVQEGTVLGYNETAIRMPQEYAHGVSGHYGPDTVVHHRSTARTDVNGEQVTYIDEIQANNAKPEEISESNFRRSKEIIEMLDAGKVLSKVRTLENKETASWDKLKIRDIDSIRHTITQTGEMYDKDAIGLVKQANMFNALLEGYVELYRNNNAEYIKDIERATSKGGTYEIKGGKPTDVQQHWANFLELQKSGEFIRHLESFRINTDSPEEILVLLEKIKTNEEMRYRVARDKIPTIDETKFKESAKIIDQIRRAAQYVYEDASGSAMDVKSGKNKSLRSIDRDMPYIPVSIGRNLGIQNPDVIGGKEFNSRIFDILSEDPVVKKSIEASEKNKAEMDKLKKRLGDMSHLRFDADEDLTFQRLSEVRSLAKTNIKKYNQTKGRKPFPLEQISEWSAVALKDIITKSIADGRDLITITHPDDSPSKSHMDKDSSRDNYGRIFPDVAQKIVGKYGIEVKQRSELPALTDAQMNNDKAYKDATEARNKVVADAMEEFKKTQGQGESPDVISELSRQFSRTPADLAKEFPDSGDMGVLWMEDKIMPLLGQVKDDGLRGKLTDVAQSIAYQHLQFISVKEDLYKQYDPSVVAIDRGMSFRLNKEIKEAVMQGELRTAYKPLDEYQGGDDYYKPKKNPFESRDEQGFLVRSATAKNAEGGTSYNPESVDWFDIGHYGGRETRELTRWENENSGLWLLDKNSGIDTINPAEFGSPDFTHAQWFAKKYPSNPSKSLPLGRYEKPRYGSDGELIEKGKISINSSAKSPIESMAEARKIKTALADKLGFKEEDFDAYLFKANPEIKQSMGFSPKDQLPIKFKPAGDEEEGGRRYTPKQMERQFIGRIATENPERIKGLKVEYGIVQGRMGEEAVVLMKDGRNIGRISWMTDKDYTDRPANDINVEIEPAYRGKGLQDVLYSEAYERMRANGTTMTRQDVYNEQGLPVRSQIKILGKNASTFETTRGEKKLTYDAFMRELNRALASGEEFVSTEGKLDPQAWYKPEEGDAPLRVNFSPNEVKKNLRSLQSAIDRQSDADKVPAGIKKGVGRLIQAVERQRKEDVKTMPQAVKEGFKALADAVDAQADMDKVPAGVRKGLRLLFEAAQYEDLKPQQAMPKPTASEEQLASGIEALGRAVGVSGQVRRQPQPQAKPAPTAAMPQAQPAPAPSPVPAAQPTPPPLPVRPTPEPSSTAWMSWTQEKTENGGFIRNALGYVIVVNKDKFKVYNPAKVLVGIYEDEESAKRRVLKDMPRR
ncbi:hypothetical protein UFOVP460_16 [uncultured Caudovirales phage]|uniref:Uncharacterized protein n=1 Tax=uncultured Caudovirales phage TaxID=2100421 RepID=A0A6J5MBV1_9CAUD|nr:hypothetical protein UFOVP460_16 [uncultured Caudovirales phage]